MSHNPIKNNKEAESMLGRSVSIPKMIGTRSMKDQKYNIFFPRLYMIEINPTEVRENIIKYGYRK
jgi:hypothetical protein